MIKLTVGWGISMTLILGFILFVVLAAIDEKEARDREIEASSRIETLREKGGDEAALEIITIADSNSDRYKLQCHVIETLEGMKSPASIPFLKRKFMESRWSGCLAQLAASALGAIGTDDAVDFLSANFNHHEGKVFDDVCYGLSKSGNSRAIPPLKAEAKNNPSAERRKQAKEALDKLVESLSKKTPNDGKSQGDPKHGE
jgi:HEAT repeat protein